MGTVALNFLFCLSDFFKHCFPGCSHLRFCCCCCLVSKSCPTVCDPMDCSLPGPSVHEIFLARILEWVAISSPGDLPDPGIEAVSPALAGRFFTAESPGKPLKVYQLINWLSYKPR